MLSMNLGPFAISSTMVSLLAGGLAAAGIGHLAARGRQERIGNTLIDMLLAGVLVARLAFVALWFDTYRLAPLSMLDIRDGGFTPWAGAGAALLVALWRGWRQPGLRKPLIFGLAAGVLLGGLTFNALRGGQPSILPEVSLTTLTGESTSLAALADGEPLVVNLWASWCPPCRREMPVLAAAQKKEVGVRFVFANQGEGGSAAQRYLMAGQLGLVNVVLDPGASLGHAISSRALPTTLFYDASGRLVDTHLGELSAASLASKLALLRKNTNRP